MSTINKKKSFNKPTVAEVFALMNQAAENYQFEKWEDVHQLIDVSDRTFRRWKKHVDSQPETISPIGFQGYALLYALANQKPYIECLNGIAIPKALIMSAEKFKARGITKDEVKTVIGLSGVSGLSVKAVAPLVGLSPNVLANQINNYKDEKISYGTWAMILMLCGVSVSKIFAAVETK